jgi:predicted dehydrogenase
MKLAVLGTDADLVALLAAAVAEGHQVAWLSDVRVEDESAIRSLTSVRAHSASDWETLLDHATADAVIVGTGTSSSDQRSEQLKRLVADAVPLLVVHPIHLSVLTYYELDMVRRDTGAILRHYNPLVGHPLLADITGWVRDGHEAIGRVLQISCARDVADGSRETVLSGLARDAELLAVVAGDIGHVSAIGPKAATHPSAIDASNVSYGSLQVQITTASPATLRWTVVPTSSATRRVELTLVGERGSIIWSRAAHGSGQASADSLWMPNHDARLEIPEHDPALAATRQLETAIANDRSQPDGLSSTWSKATQAMEVVDAVELSLQKGRTIEVHQQQLTAQLAFRGTMVAIGCGVLLLAAVATVIAGVVGGAEAVLQQPLIKPWSRVLLALLAFFLLLQLVPYLGSKRRRKQAGESE